MPNIVDLIQNDQQIQEAYQGVKEFTQGVVKGLTTDLVGSVGDFVNKGRQNVGSDPLPIGTDNIRAMLGMQPIANDTLNETLGNLSSIAVAPEKIIPGIAATFVGPKAIGFDKAIAKSVEEATKAGKTVISDYKMMPDGIVKKEISDTKLKVLREVTNQELNDMARTIGYDKPYKDLSHAEQGEVLYEAHYGKPFIAQHPELEKAYPILGQIMKDMNLRLDHKMVNGGEGSLIDLGKYGMLIEGKAANKEELRSVAAHELQHAVQIIEGWQAGGNSNSVRNLAVYDLTEKMAQAKSNITLDEATKQSLAYQVYKRLYGEAEARLVENRINLNQQMRNMTGFGDHNNGGFDIPKSEMILGIAATKRK